MKFKINYNEWQIKLVDEKVLLEKYKDDDVKALFGVTSYKEHEILLDKNMCEEQQIRTLIHELTHCYIWEYGLYYAPNFNEEMACDLVSSSFNFMYDVITEFINNKE